MTAREHFLDLTRQRAPKYTKPKQTLVEQLDRLFKHEYLLTENLNTNSIHGIKFAIIGGHGLNLHGIARMTHDIDLLVSTQDQEKARMMLNGGQPTNLDSPRPDRPIQGISFQDPNGHIYDLIWINQPWAKEALSDIKQTSSGPVLKIQYLIMSKLWAGRGMQDDTDVTNLIKATNEQELQAARNLVAKYLPSDIGDFGQMIEIAKLI